MPRTKKIDTEGDLITVETPEVETFQKKKVLSYTEAKKTMKKEEMTDKQKAHIAKLVEANKARMEAARQKKEEEMKERIRAELEAERKALETEKKEQILVAPKRVYKPRKAPPKVVIQEEEEEEEEEENEEDEKEEEIVQVPKQVHKQIPKSQQQVQQQQVQRPTNKYMTMLKF